MIIHQNPAGRKTNHPSKAAKKDLTINLEYVGHQIKTYTATTHPEKILQFRTKERK